jgi:hypothetical protein
MAIAQGKRQTNKTLDGKVDGFYFSVSDQNGKSILYAKRVDSVMRA